jgi:hypothetical protein
VGNIYDVEGLVWRQKCGQLHVLGNSQRQTLAETKIVIDETDCGWMIVQW